MAGLPKKLTWGQGQETTFKYDAAGTRVFKRDATSSVVNVPGLFERRNPAGTGGTDIHNLHNIVVDGRAVAQVNKIQTSPTGPATTKVSYVHGDGQGSTMLVTNENGTSAGGADGFLADLYYDPFGRRIDANYLPLGNQRHGGPRQGYTSHDHDDEIGLINMKGRIYDPETRRFLTPDPIIENPFNSQSLNRYAYVQNNPTTYTDPTGYEPQRSASYWERRPQSFDARAEGVSKAIIYRLSNGTIVILLFRNTGTVNGKAMTSAASHDDDAGKKASITTHAGGRPSFTPDKVADYLEAMAERKAERQKVDKARFLEYFTSRILYGKSEDDLRVFVGRLEARGCWEEGSIGGEQLEAAKVALYALEYKLDSKQPVLDNEGRASWGLGAYVYTKAEMKQIQRATTTKAAASVLTAPPGHETGNLASGYRFWLTGDPSDAAFFGAMFDSAGALAGAARGVDYHINDGINNRPPEPMQPDPLKDY
jgi:RHS repeat-associated protein